MKLLLLVAALSFSVPAEAFEFRGCTTCSVGCPHKCRFDDSSYPSSPIAAPTEQQSPDYSGSLRGAISLDNLLAAEEAAMNQGNYRKAVDSLSMMHRQFLDADARRRIASLLRVAKERFAAQLNDQASAHIEAGNFRAARYRYQEAADLRTNQMNFFQGNRTRALYLESEEGYGRLPRRIAPVVRPLEEYLAYQRKGEEIQREIHRFMAPGISVRPQTEIAKIFIMHREAIINAAVKLLVTPAAVTIAVPTDPLRREMMVDETAKNLRELMAKVLEATLDQMASDVKTLVPMRRGIDRKTAEDFIRRWDEAFARILDEAYKNLDTKAFAYSTSAGGTVIYYDSGDAFSQLQRINDEKRWRIQ